ncbi:MAG TPA: hypothetical protein VGM10_07160 [Actinocrinis sp.]|jgi:hypothetical protein
MTVESFAVCLNGLIQTDVDELQKLPEEDWNKLVGWWSWLSREAKAYLEWLATRSMDKFLEIVGAALALAGAALEALRVILSAVTLRVLIDSTLACAYQLALPPEDRVW